jgi:branched-subunit amino acid aminotransferase/4-amino-4-deoxychorismate lyase
MTSVTNAAWLANAVFDGARAFEGVAPDLDLHCERVIRPPRRRDHAGGRVTMVGREEC